MSAISTLSTTSVGRLQTRLGRLIAQLDAQAPPIVATLPDELVQQLGTSAFGERYGDFLVFNKAVGRHRTVTATSSPAHPGTALSISVEECNEYENLKQAIDAQVIKPTIRTESAVAWIGVAFFAAIIIAGIAASTVGASTYSAVVSFAVGTGGAAAYLQSFHSDLASYLRTRRTLLNIESTWNIEGVGDPAQISALAKQMSAFLTQITQMPSAYAAGSKSSSS